MPKWAFGELKGGGIRICKCGEVTLEDDMHICTLEDKVEEEPDFSLDDISMFDMAVAGKMGLGLYRAVVRDGGSSTEAFTVTAAFFAGLFKGSTDDKNEDRTDT